MQEMRKLEMQEIRKVAKAYFDGQKEEDKAAAKRFFNSVDGNGDGKVRFEEEYKTHVAHSHFSFKMLDTNGNGNLDWEDALTLYYIDNALMPRCKGCNAVILSTSYFSCLPCLGKSSYYLCCACYAARSFNHHHASSDFADTRALLKLAGRLMKDAEVAAAAPPYAPSLRELTVAEKLPICSKKKIIIKGVGVGAAAQAVASVGCSIM